MAYVPANGTDLMFLDIFLWPDKVFQRTHMNHLSSSEISLPPLSWRMAENRREVHPGINGLLKTGGPRSTVEHNPTNHDRLSIESLQFYLGIASNYKCMQSHAAQVAISIQ